MKAIIIDDELLSGQFLQEIIESNCKEIREVESYTSPNEALEVISNNFFDIIFLDVEMPEMSSFDFIEKANISPQTSIIIVSAYSQYAVEAYKIEVLHYLLKPVTAEDVKTAVKRVIKQKEKSIEIKDSISNTTITIYDGDQYVLLKKDQIIHLEADGSYTYVHLVNGKKHFVSKRIGYFESLLKQPPFFRCHKSHLVNLNMLSSIDNGRSGFLSLTNNQKIPISQEYKHKLKEILGY